MALIDPTTLFPPKAANVVGGNSGLSQWQANVEAVLAGLYQQAKASAALQGNIAKAQVNFSLPQCSYLAAVLY